MKIKGLIIALLLIAQTGCGALSGSTPEPLPTVVLGDGNPPPESSPGSPPVSTGGMAASGTVVPAQEARIASKLGEIVLRVNVATGDRVEAGQVLVELSGREKLAAAIESASLELLTAQQALEQLDQDWPDQQTAALQELTDARQAVRDAERMLNGLNAPAEDLDIEAAWATVVLRRDDLEKARKDYEPYENKPVDNLQRAAFLNRLAEVQSLYDDAVRRYNNLAGITGSGFERSQAEAELQIAEKRLELAQEKYDTLQSGPDPDEVALAEARIQNATVQIEASQSALADLELKAPFTGTVAELNIHAGEWVTPGQTLLTLVDLDHLQVETTDLSERDIPRVEIGGAVRVFIEALNQEVTGRVSQIAPLADILGGDVVYRTTIELDTLPPGLRAGMSVEVRFEAGP